MGLIDRRSSRDNPFGHKKIESRYCGQKWTILSPIYELCDQKLVYTDVGYNFEMPVTDFAPREMSNM